jgi:hypothetical protein
MRRQASPQFTITFLVTAILASVAQAGTFTLTFQPVVPNAVVVTYDPANGNLSFDGNGVLIVAMEIISSNSLFDLLKANDGVIPWDPSGIPLKFFKLSVEGIDRVDIGPVLPAGLTSEFLLADLQVDGSIKPSGKLTDAPGGGPYLFVVPEPSSLTLVACGVLGLLRLRVK